MQVEVNKVTAVSLRLQMKDMFLTLCCTVTPVIDMLLFYFVIERLKKH